MVTDALHSVTTQDEVNLILADSTKLIATDINWLPDPDHPPALRFRVPVISAQEVLLKIQGRWNPKAGKLSYILLHPGLGRIYALDMGVEHRNPTGGCIGDVHKHTWTDRYRDAMAYVPLDITATWDQPVEVWRQFCAEANIRHDGTLATPHWQEELRL
ncbi:MAG: hypothetical protein OXH10_02665 [bacterium]|nr:hypothetical protein [bacterium]MCY3579366.1 hypothetical protein [bacterium]MDE0643139.1 hypothetical protein [bacterium]MYH56398.1 hypothetical protein [Acidimicrobiia bacterium]